MNFFSFRKMVCLFFKYKGDVLTTTLGSVWLKAETLTKNQLGIWVTLQRTEWEWEHCMQLDMHDCVVCWALISQSVHFLWLKKLSIHTLYHISSPYSVEIHTTKIGHVSIFFPCGHF